MRKSIGIFVLCLAGDSLALAQKWEFGGGAGGGFYTSQDITSPAGTAAGKFKSNIAASGWIGNTGHRWGGELRYDYQRGDMQLKGQGQQATFGAETHAIHYDFTLNGGSVESRLRPFVAFGGGVKVYRGTGTETTFQPLGKVALLTKTQDTTGLVSIGAGIKFKLSNRVAFRAEVHDYLTPFPKSVIAPALGASVSGWLQDIVPMVGLRVLF